MLYIILGRARDDFKTGSAWSKQLSQTTQGSLRDEFMCIQVLATVIHKDVYE
jgi:hypothetical protein